MKVKIQNRNEWIILDKLPDVDIIEGMEVVVKFNNNYYYGKVISTPSSLCIKVIGDNTLMFTIDTVELFKYKKS